MNKKQVLCILSLLTLNALATTRVVCVGDSITAGYGMPKEKRATHSYPSVLASLLGNGYDVSNLGASGRTLLRDEEKAWIKTSHPAKFQELKPDVIIFMLGTNDSKMDHWKNKRNFERDLKTFIEDFRKIKSDVKIYLCLPPPAFNRKTKQLSSGEGISGVRILNEVIPLIRKVADEHDIPIIDLNTPLMGYPEDFPDGVHPNEQGAAYIAKVVDENIKPAVSKRSSEKDDIVPKKYKPTLEDVSYGPHERNKLDFWKADSEKPTPLVLYIHGGGWGGGSKESNSGPSLGLFKEGVSYVSINYRLARKGNVLPCSLHDAARALQFVRYKAKEWNVDPDRIVINGGSAGGCSGLWLAYHDDLADPDSEDPVARQSTRIAAAGVISAQSTLDPWVIKERIGPSAAGHSMIWASVGAKNSKDVFINWERYKDLAFECSPINHVSKEDPPVWLLYGNDEPVPVKSKGIHHAEFGRMLKNKCEEVGLECELSIGSQKNRDDRIDQFFRLIFNLDE